MTRKILAVWLIATTLSFATELTPLNKIWEIDSGWTVLKDATVEQQTLVLSKQPDTSECPFASRRLQIVPEKDYELVFEYRGNNVGAGGEIKVFGSKTLPKRIYNHNTLWNPVVIPFQAQGETVQAEFRLNPGQAAASKWELRNMVVREKGEVLPPWGRKATSDQPWGYCFTDGSIKSDDDGMFYHPVPGTNNFDVTIVDVWPENDHRLLITARSAAPATQPTRLQWRLDMLNLNGHIIESPVTGELQMGASWQQIDRAFRFPATTALLKLSIAFKGENLNSVEFQDFSLQRIIRDN